MELLIQEESRHAAALTALRHVGYTRVGFLRAYFTQFDFYLESADVTRRFLLSTPRR